MDPLESVVLEGSGKFTYISSLLSSEEKRAATARIAKKHRRVRLECHALPSHGRREGARHRTETP